MSKPNITSIASVEDRSLPIFDELDALAERIRQRAFGLFAQRGFAAGDDMRDWLRAEREICWPASELVENGDYALTLELPGYKPDDITVTATPRELIVKAERRVGREDGDDNDTESVVRWSELHRDEVYRHVALPADIDPERVTAEYRHGLLTVKAPKTGKPQSPSTRIKVSSAA